MEASSQIQNLLVSVIAASVWQLFYLSDLGPSLAEVGTTDRNGGNYLIAVIHRGQKYQRNYGSISAETSRVYRTGNQKF